MPRALKREAEAAKQEKEDPMMRVETLEVCTTRLVDMKEQQDVEVEVLGSRARELAGQVSGLQGSLAEVEERREEEVTTLTTQLVAPSVQEGAQGVADLGVKVAGLAREQEEVAGEAAEGPGRRD